jgi:hypothetical protein
VSSLRSLDPSCLDELRCFGPGWRIPSRVYHRCVAPCPLAFIISAWLLANSRRGSERGSLELNRGVGLDGFFFFFGFNRGWHLLTGTKGLLLERREDPTIGVRYRQGTGHAPPTEGRGSSWGSGKANQGGQCPKARPHGVRGDVDHRECESQALSRFTALFVEAGA